jgi:hypothetical protein
MANSCSLWKLHLERGNRKGPIGNDANKKSNSPKNTIVVGRVGALCGNVHFIQNSCWITDNALIVRLISERVVPEFLVALLKAANLNERASKSAQPLITGETVKSLKVRIPDRETQAKAYGEISQKNRENTRLSSLVEASIDGLREFRAALITAAVTGEIDVATWRKRGATTRHLDRVEEKVTGMKKTPKKHAASSAHKEIVLEQHLVTQLVQGQGYIERSP